MVRIEVLPAALLIAAAIGACAAPVTSPQVDQVTTVVAQTMQALASVPPLPSPAPTQPPASTRPLQLLPHSLCFHNNDKNGRM